MSREYTTLVQVRSLLCSFRSVSASPLAHFSIGVLIRQIAEHSHYVQGVAWDPWNEYIATQSSDRSVHIYSLKTKDGQYALTSHDEKTPKIASHAKADLPPRRISSNSPAPPDMGYRSQLAAAIDTRVLLSAPRTIRTWDAAIRSPTDEPPKCC